MKLTVDDLVAQVAEEIGDDMVYITASDEERHFDPATVAFSFATILALSFINGFMGAAKEDFRRLGEGAYARLMEKLKGLVAEGPKNDKTVIAKQKRFIAEARKSTARISRRNPSLFTANHVAEGEGEVTKILRAYHFNDTRGKILSKTVATSVVKYLKEGSDEYRS